MMGAQMQLEDWLDDLCVRFIINLPEEDLSSVARICFQVEEAQWFYEDFIRPLDPSLPSMSLRTFCLRIFQHCPLLASFSVENHTRAFEEFLQYKTRVPVRGAILLNHEMDSTVLVKGWKKGANWSFPRGKINKDEDDLDCAVREVWEETGLDLRAAGLVPTESKPKYIEISMREQQMRLYVFRDVPMDTNFQPRTRKEISKIKWYKLSELPAFRKKGQSQNQSDVGSNANKFYMVAPFLVPLKKWVVSQKSRDAKKAPLSGNTNLSAQFSVDEAPTEDDAWPQSTTEPAALRALAIDTLEGATNELQRLLKVQPTMHSASQEDSASALLSMLQVKGSAPTGHSQVSSHAPHTPLEMSAQEAQQPRNPHHNTNQHYQHLSTNQPPPPFSLQPQTIQHDPGPTWDVPQQYTLQGRQPPQGFNGSSQQFQALQQTPLVHPQPLPPQVQRSVFNKSVGQDTQCALPAHGMRHQPEPSLKSLPLTQPQLNVSSNAPRPQRLDGQSMALLNAFKQGSSSSAPTQSQEPPRVAPDSGYPSQSLQYSQPSSVFQGQAQPSELASATPQNVLAAHAPPDQHRSSLLGMFKNVNTDAPTQGSSVSPQAIAEAPGMERNLLEALRRGPSEAELAPKPAPQKLPNQTAALSDFLSMKPRAADQQKQVPAAATAPITTQSNMSSNVKPQPIRILQRGQGIETPSLGVQSEKPPSRSPFSTYSQPASGSYASSTFAGPQRSPATSQRQSEAPPDQKRRLLSLFGKQQQPGAADSPAGPGETSSGKGSPARTGTGTPMSPAEQTFLLDYLQSVTNTTSR